MRILLICLLALCGTAAQACSCPNNIQVTSEKIKVDHGWSDVVFVGEVMEADGDRTVFRVLRALKGVAAGDVVTARYFDSCSTLYKDGFHLIYGSLQEGEVNTSYCSLNKELKPADYTAVAEGEDAFREFLRNDVTAYDAHLSVLEELRAEALSNESVTAAPFPYARFVFFLLFVILVVGWWLPVLRRGFRGEDI